MERPTDIEEKSGAQFRWTYGSSPFFSSGASGLPQRGGMSPWYGREAYPAAAMERYSMGAPWDRATQGPPAGGWHRGNHWGTFRGPDGNFNDPRLAEFRNWGGLNNMVDAPGGGTNSMMNVWNEKRGEERDISKHLLDSLKDGDMQHAMMIMEQGLTTALIDALPTTPHGSNLTKAMVFAARNGHYEVIEVFIHQGGNPDLTALNQGYSLLHEAILAGQPDVVEVLCRHHARTDLCNTHGINARDLAEACVARTMVDITLPLERYEDCLDAVNRSHHMRVKADVDHASVGIRHWGKETRSAVGPARIYRDMA